MPFADINGNEIYFEDSGGDGPAIVFSHGFALNHSMWDGVVAELREQYRCITWDTRGHGLSGVSAAHTEWDLADDIAGLLDHLRIDRAVAAGLSQGGFATYRFGLAHPDRALALALIDTRPDRTEPIDGYTQMADAWVTHGPVGELIAGFAAVQFGPDVDASAWIRYWQGRPRSDWRTPWDSILKQDTVTERLGEISCPTLVVHGTADVAVPVDRAELAAAALPNNRGLVLIEGAPHVSAVTHPREVAAALRHFLAEIDLPVPA